MTRASLNWGYSSDLTQDKLTSALFSQFFQGQYITNIILEAYEGYASRIWEERKGKCIEVWKPHVILSILYSLLWSTERPQIFLKTEATQSDM